MTVKRKTDYNHPPSTELIVPIIKFKDDIGKRIRIGEEILLKNIKTQVDFDNNKEEYNDWDDYNSEYLKQSFNNELNEYKEGYDTCATYVGLMIRAQTIQEKLDILKERVNTKLSNLRKLLAKADLLKCSIDSKEEIPSTKIITVSNNIFIVHGHDDRTKLDIARTIEKLGLNPIILSEQPNQGQTVIEKFELHSDVGFAVVLLTADDLGKVKTDKDEKYRARQNVILEMGYFIGKLGRNKVFPLYENGVELPSDLHGVLYNPLDLTGGWKLKLAKELIAAGYSVDANKLL